MNYHQATYTADLLKCINPKHIDFLERVHSIMSNTPIRRNQHDRNNRFISIFNAEGGFYVER